MRVCTCFLLFGIIAYTDSFASNKPKSNQRSVNLALETVLEFSNKDKEVDINFLNNVQNFITNVKTVIDENNDLRRNVKAPRVKTFTEFIQDVIHILNTYEDTAFTDFFYILDEEIRNYHYRGCRFYELTENYEIRTLIAEKLDSIKGKPPSVTKANINALSDMLKDDYYDRHVKEIVNYINSLYKQDAEENFQKVITDLEAYGRSKSKRSKNNLSKIIKNGVRTIIFDHYTDLNTNARRDVKKRVETFWEQLNKKKPSRGDIPNDKPYSQSRNNAKNSENIMNETVSRKDLMNNANKQIEVTKKHENNKNGTEIKQPEFKKAQMKRDHVKKLKKRYKHTRQVTVDEPLDIQDKENRLSSQNTGHIIGQQRSKNEHQEQPKIDSLLSESLKSLEFYQEPQHKTTQYIAIIPKEVSQKPSTKVIKKLEKIKDLNALQRMGANNTVKKIWIEESTGRLPKAVLEKLTIKPSGHASRHNMTEPLNKHSHKYKKYDKDQKMWHGKVYEPKYEKNYEKKYDKEHDKKRVMPNWSENDTKYKSRQKQKSEQYKKHMNDKTSTPNDRFILVHNRDFFRQNYFQTTHVVFNMEVHQAERQQENKNSMEPLRVKLKQHKRWGTATTKMQKFLDVLDVLMPSKSGKTVKSPRAKRFNKIIRMRPTQKTSPPLTHSSMRRLAIAVDTKMLPRKPEWLFKKSAEHPSSSDEGMTVETSEIKDNIRRHGRNVKRTSSSLEKDPYVIERIKNLERQLNQVQNRMNVNTDVVTARKVTHSFGSNDDVVKRKQTKTRLRSDVNNFPNDYKVRQAKLKMAGTSDNKTKHIIENKYVKDEDSTINEIEDNIQNDKKSVTKLKFDVNMIPNDFKDRTDKTKEAEKPDNKTDVKDKDLFVFKDKNKEEKGVYDNEIEKQETIKKDKNPEISLTNIGDVSPKTKDKGIQVMMNKDNGDDALKETVTENRKVPSLNTSTKAMESTTKTTTTVQSTDAITSATTLKLSTMSVSVPVPTSPKLADVLKKAEFYSTAANNTTQVAEINKTTLNITKEVINEVVNKNVTNFPTDATPTK